MKRETAFHIAYLKTEIEKKIQIGILLLVIYELLSLVDRASYLNR